MHIFISWSGERSKKIAIVLREWVKVMFHGAEVFCSDKDISAGQMWNEVISKNLEGSSIGLICVTSENQTEPWLMFEAGAIGKGSNNSLVIPILFDLKKADLSGPLSGFQMVEYDHMHAEDAFKSMNSKYDHKLEEAVFYKNFSLFKSEYADKIDEILKASTGTKQKKRSMESKIDEMLDILRNKRYKGMDRGIGLEESRALLDALNLAESLMRDIDIVANNDTLVKLTVFLASMKETIYAVMDNRVITLFDAMVKELQKREQVWRRSKDKEQEE